MIQVLHLNSDILIFTLQCKSNVPEALIGERRGAYVLLVGKPKERGLLGRPWRRWEDKIKMDHQDVGLGLMEWNDLAQNRVCGNKPRVPLNAGNLLTS